ncbi:hypothetical protein NDU88_001205 [Pleurodeles waltl]|uniref:Uncharacterized protein n=1 Tax=Pleurodeles waltl TaxID=8319 RepID=A0AAV7S963_PLEWA|nr:hypothetical protein NDU88_001205 [Pleurodeles waltl]
MPPKKELPVKKSLGKPAAKPKAAEPAPAAKPKAPEPAPVREKPKEPAIDLSKVVVSERSPSATGRVQRRCTVEERVTAKTRRIKTN